MAHLPPPISTRLRLPVALYQQLKAMADREGRSLHNLIIRLLTKALEETPQ
jgi:predicted HicB family RNase H-like nuclease